MVRVSEKLHLDESRTKALFIVVVVITCVHTCVCTGMHAMELEGNFCGVGSRLPPFCGFQGLSSGLQA